MVGRNVSIDVISLMIVIGGEVIEIKGNVRRFDRQLLTNVDVRRRVVAVMMPSIWHMIAILIIRFEGTSNPPRTCIYRATYRRTESATKEEKKQRYRLCLP